MKRKTTISMITVLALAMGTAQSVLATGNPVSSEREVLALVVTVWDSGCSGSTRNPWDNMVDAWYDDITNDSSTPRGHGSKAWNRDGFYHNGDIVDSRFTDSDLNDFGNDDSNDNLDDVDVAMVGLHGSHGSVSWRGKVRVNESGDGNCRAVQNHIELGDHDLEFLHLSSCHSMCDLNESYSGWPTSFKGLHQVNGFYGIMWISTTYSGNYKNFADDSFDDAIAVSWVENQYSNGFWTGGYDHCPVSMVAGASETNAEVRATYEEYDYVYGDISSPSNFCYVYIGGCDPKAHDP